MRLRESDIIGWIREHLPGGSHLHDDCGQVPLPAPGEVLLVTTDLMESGQHFSLHWHPPRLLGRKLLAVNLSDLDASGASPLGFTLTLALGRDLDPAWVLELLEGIAEASREHGVPVLGGDTVGRAEGLGLGITAFGSARRWLQRSGVLPGDWIYVDAWPGASLRGLRKLREGRRWDPASTDPDLAAHLDPRPELGLGRKLAACPEVHACIDLSDGLSKDLAMLAEASGLSLVLERSLDEDALEGGEDYARCFACSLDPGGICSLLGRDVHPVARAVEAREAPLLRYDGDRLLPLVDRSFDHFRPSK